MFRCGAVLAVMDAAAGEHGRVCIAMYRLTLHAGAVQLGLQQHPQARDFLSLQLVQPRPHVVAHQVQLFAQAAVLGGEGGGNAPSEGGWRWGAEPSRRCSDTDLDVLGVGRLQLLPEVRVGLQNLDHLPQVAVVVQPRVLQGAAQRQTSSLDHWKRS